MIEKYMKYLKESRKMRMTPEQIASAYGKEIKQKAKTGYGKVMGSKIDRLAIAVFDYLYDKGGVYRNLAEGMGDEDLKETAKELVNLYGTG